VFSIAMRYAFCTSVANIHMLSYSQQTCSLVHNYFLTKDCNISSTHPSSWTTKYSEATNVILLSKFDYNIKTCGIIVFCMPFTWVPRFRSTKPTCFLSVYLCLWQSQGRNRTYTSDQEKTWLDRMTCGPTSFPVKQRGLTHWYGSMWSEGG
jgi:hypothetical protein